MNEQVMDRPAKVCIETIDKKIEPLYTKKLDKWIFIPTVSLIIVLIGVVFAIANAKPSQKDVERVERQVQKYDGMELRIVKQMNANQEKILNEIKELKR